MTDIEQLKKETDEIKKGLEDLKNNVSISESEKKTKAEELKTKAESTKHKIESEIASLSEKTDDESKRKKEEAETLLNTFNETVNLYASVLASSETKPEEEKKETTDTEKKGFFKKTGEWIGEQRDDVWSKEKWEKEGGINLLRTAGFVATGVGAISLAVKGIKKLFGKDKKKEKKSDSSDSSKDKEEKKDKSFWDGTVGKTIKTVGSVLAVGSVGYYVAHGLYTQNRGLKDLRDREKGKKLEFDAALNYSKGIANNKDEKHMAYGMELDYDENTQEIIAYGEKIKIDKNARKIGGLDVDFKKYEDMICTAILIAYIKKEYSGKCDVAAPFSLGSSWNGNVNVGGETAVNGTGTGWRTSLTAAGGIAGIAAGIFSGSVAVGATTTLGLGGAGYIGGQQADQNNIMHNFMPELDNEYGKKSLISYLNNLNCWQAKNQTKEDITESPIKATIDEVVNEIQELNKKRNEQTKGSRMGLDAIQDSQDNTKYTIKAYGREIKAEITGDSGKQEMRILGISGGSPKIKVDTDKGNISNLKVPLKEGLYMSALIGELLEDYHHKCEKYPYFEMKTELLRSHQLKVGYEYLIKGKSLEESTEMRGLFANTTKARLGLDKLIYPTQLLKQNMPTIFNDKQSKNNFIEFLNNGITDENNISIRQK